MGLVGHAGDSWPCSEDDSETYKGIDCALFCTSTGALSSYQNGVKSQSMGAGHRYTATDVLTVRRRGTTVTYLKNLAQVGSCGMSMNGDVQVDTAMKSSTDAFTVSEWSAPQCYTPTPPPTPPTPPTSNPTASPTAAPTTEPPTPSPTRSPTMAPTSAPTLSPTPATPCSEPLAWKEVVNAQTLANGGLQKNGGTANKWTAGATSIQNSSGDVDVNFRCSLKSNLMLGLSFTDCAAGHAGDSWPCSPDASATYKGIDCALNCGPGTVHMSTVPGTLIVYENGINKGSAGTYTDCDLLTVRRRGTSVTFLKNGALIGSCPLRMSGDVHVDTSLRSTVDSLTDVNWMNTTCMAAAAAPPPAPGPCRALPAVSRSPPRPSPAQATPAGPCASPARRRRPRRGGRPQRGSLPARG